MEKLNMHTQDMADANIEKIGQLFPNCLTERLNEKGQPETAIDFDKLKQELSKEIKDVFSVNDGFLIACFDEDVNETVITEVAKKKPYYFIMRDKSLSSDQVADNFEQIFNAYSKDTIRKIL